MASVYLERDWRGRDIRGAISKHGRGKVGDFGGRGDGAALVSSRERVVLSRRLREPCGRRNKYQSAILARPVSSTLSGRGIHVSPIRSAVCCGPRRPALLNDPGRHPRQADRCGELVRGAQGEVAEMIQSPPHDLRRVIGFAGGTVLIVGITIGSGIFRTPPTIAGLVPNPLVIMGLWTAFGLISICGALAVAELSTLLPRAGGVYVFLREAYGDAAAFVFGWLYVLVTTPTTVAALSVVFAEFLLNLLGVSVRASTVQLIAIAAIVTLTFANVLGAQVGAAVSGVTTLVKVTALAAIILGAFLLGHGSLSHFTEGGGRRRAGRRAGARGRRGHLDLRRLDWRQHDCGRGRGTRATDEADHHRGDAGHRHALHRREPGLPLHHAGQHHGAAKGSDCPDGHDGDRRPRRWRRHHARNHDERIWRAQRQLTRQDARPVRGGARRPARHLERET